MSVRPQSSALRCRLSIGLSVRLSVCRSVLNFSISQETSFVFLTQVRSRRVRMTAWMDRLRAGGLSRPILMFAYINRIKYVCICVTFSFL